jgi:hypothetical protein
LCRSVSSIIIIGVSVYGAPQHDGSLHRQESTVHTGAFRLLYQFSGALFVQMVHLITPRRQTHWVKVEAVPK